MDHAFTIPIHDGEIETFPGESPGDRRSQIPYPARDDRNPSDFIHHTRPPGPMSLGSSMLVDQLSRVKTVSGSWS